MRELRLDDAFWRDALGAIREGGLRALAERQPAMAELLEELAPDAGGGPVVIGARLAAPGRNGRLLAFLGAALMAREGARTLLLDLSSDLRWLEHLVGEGLKEGLVDHLRYGVPLDRCVRPTALPGLSVLTGGAYFLAGSPLEDAPGLRAAIGDLRRGHDAVLVVFPHPVKTADETGLAARCDALLTVQEGDGPIPLAGSERASIRLVGDPQAAWELVRLADAFLGPLPVLLAGSGPAEAPGRERAKPELRRSAAGDREEEAAPSERNPADRREERKSSPVPPPPIGRPDLPSRKALEEIDFLRAFEDDRAGRATGPRELRPLTPTPPEEPTAAVGSRSRRLGAGVWIGGAAALVGALLVVGVATGRFDPLFPGGGAPDPFDLPEAEPGILVPLAREEPADAAGGADPEPDTGAETADAPEPAGESAPWSVHVGSYATSEAGDRLVDRLARADRVAFLAPVDLPGKGVWNRVFVGAYADSSSAGAALAELLGSGVVEEGVVRRTPWAYRIGEPAERSVAERRRDELAREGIPAYVLGEGPARVWAGAYRDVAEAALMGRMVEATADAVLEQRIH